MLPHLCYQLCLGKEEMESVYLHHSLEIRHLILAQPLPHYIIHKQDLCLRMVHEVVHIPGLELVEDRHWHCTVCEGRYESHAPVGLVSGAYGHLVASYQSAFLIHYVHLGYPPCHITVMQGNALIIGQGRPVPVFPETLLVKLID